MVLRCYSRRHLVPATRALQRQLSTVGPAAAAYTPALAAQARSTDAASTSHSSTSAAQHQPHESWSFFFPDHLPWTQRQPSSARARHPLVKKLISEIYSTSREPAANRVWKAYMDLKESYDSDAAGTSSAASTSLLTQLEPVHLQHLLRAIDPSVARTRKLSRAESKRRQTMQQQQSLLASGNSPSKILLVEPHSSRHSGKIFDAQHSVREYMRRVRIIFRDMRLHSSIAPTTSSTVDALPSLADYNHVLSRLASGGHIGPMSDIWNDINGVSPKAGSKGLHPNLYTYRELMVGLSRHATEQIERVQKGEASKTLNYSGKKKQLEKSARAAAAGMAKFGQVLAPSARAAAILAALRTMALFKDMKDHAVTPDQITLDFAARTLRLAGHIDGLHLLMQQAYGIDLASPDSADATQMQQVGVSPTTHTLNTILMALGEQASVPEMVAAFETLAKPLPLNSARTDAASSGEGVFSTNWKDIFNSMRNRDAEVAQQGTNPHKVSVPDVFVYTYPYRIAPNTKTFEILLRHCCSEVDPLRSPVALKTEGNTSSVATLAKESTEMALAEMQDGGRRAAEMERRARGGYTLFAKSLLSEALDRSDELLRLTARNLGIEIERTEQSASASEITSERASSTGEVGSDAAVSVPIRPEYQSVSVRPGRAVDADFLPILEPPTFSITAAMVEPFFSLASMRKHFGDIRWARAALSKALENKAAEAQVIDAAWRVYSARFSKARQMLSAQDNSSEPAPNDVETLAPLQLNDQKPNEVYAFLNRLRQQHRLAARQAQALEQLLYDRLDERLHDLTTRRSQRQAQRVLTHREQRIKAEQLKLEEEEREAARKAQAAEARRLRALQKEEQEKQQASAENASSHLETASPVTA
ncbi:uncharacterized protein UTRI_00862_B [Ustilago trichophora]|uniref:Uncharacterized protein n=1 Tax=Ustilago trichophora TaxID=86804 RepID=A0A5C3DQQ0_9BASI|nr:uncharacterized protein UTRI_00862_B [Ustilago trichophora]